ncbi:MAG: transposase [Xanthobacteraceae bacterium]
MDTFSAPVFSDDQKARRYLERLRWPDGPLCPSCGGIDRAYEIKPAGVYRCADPECHANFTVTMDTVMERSHIALHKWLRAFHLMCSSRTGISARQLHRTLGITYRSAWFMVQRIRKAMTAGGVDSFGGTRAGVEDEPAKRATSAKKRTRRKNP